MQEKTKRILYCYNFFEIKEKVRKKSSSRCYIRINGSTDIWKTLIDKYFKIIWERQLILYSFYKVNLGLVSNWKVIV